MKSRSDAEARRNNLPRRIYGEVRCAPNGAGFAIELDGRLARTPAKSPLLLPTAALGEAIASEWSEQGSRIDPETMPLTRLANTAIDGATPRAADVAAEIVKYAGSDLVCYRATHPAELVARQCAAWDPLLAWLGTGLGASLVVVDGLMPVAQSPTEMSRVAGAVRQLDPFRLTALHVMTTLTGSAVIALALHARAVGERDAWAAAHVDEDWQVEQWGFDAEAAARRQRREREMRAAVRLLSLLAEPSPPLSTARPAAT